MNKRYILMLLLLLQSIAMWAQQELKGRVLDAETGETLPYAQILTNDGKGCLCNGDGEFVLQDSNADSIRVSFIGYTTKWISIQTNLLDISLQPLSRTLREVEVTPRSTRSILNALAKRLEKEYKKGKKAEAYYFCRVSEQSDKVNDLMESVIKARSAINMRQPEVMTGRHSSMKQKGGKPSLAQMNLHHILEIGPIMHDAVFWDEVVAPLNRILFFSPLKYYDFDYDILSQKNGDAMYRIVMVRSDLAKFNNIRQIEGTLYVAVGSEQLLRFEARLPNMQMTTIGNKGTFRIEDVETRINMREVSVHARHNGMRGFDDSMPCLIIDAEEAFNLTFDAGMYNFARYLVADYGMDYPYVQAPIWRERTQRKLEENIQYDNIEMRYGISPMRRSLPPYRDMFEGVPEDSLYARKYLVSFSQIHSKEEKREYNRGIDKELLYTDYNRRLPGNWRYRGTDLPVTTLVSYPYADQSERMYYRDRHYTLQGFAYPAEFYSPDYSRRKLADKPADYRRTLYWNPHIKLDSNGEAEVKFYNCSRQTEPSADAQGQSEDGTLLWNGDF